MESLGHKHDKWGIRVESNKFATALETAYPTPLARAIAAKLITALQNRGFKLQPETLDAVGEFHNAAVRSQGYNQRQADYHL